MQSELNGSPGSDHGPWAEHARAAGDGIRAVDRWREIRTLGGGSPATSLPDGRFVVQFASNDYLGLSQHPAVISAAVEATLQWGTGSGASRLVVGSRPVHDELETELAAWKHADAALLFASGYAANVGVLTALARLGAEIDEPVAIVSDELNHASIIDGTRLARVPVAVYPHNDVDAAAAAIAAHARDRRRTVVVTDSVFSMDGDVAPLAELGALAASTGSLLVVDDAHAVFAGHGADALVGSGAEVLVIGTLSKTLGSLGGFVTGPVPLIEWFRNTARSFIFSTATPPAVAASALAALRIVRSPEGAALVDVLRANVDRLAPGHPSAVVPIVFGDERRTLEASEALLEQGLLVPAIRPPTVAVGASRLRVAISSDHTEVMGRLVDALASLASLGMPLTSSADSR